MCAIQCALLRIDTVKKIIKLYLKMSVTSSHQCMKVLLLYTAKVR